MFLARLKTMLSLKKGCLLVLYGLFTYLSLSFYTLRKKFFVVGIFFCLTLYLSSVYFIHYVLYKKNKKKKFGLFCGG